MIKRIFYIFSFLFSFSQIQAQTPTYDECNTAIQLGTAPIGTCTTTEYTNVNATLSSGLFSNPAENIPSCWGSVDHDVWFEFQAPIDGSYVDFEVTVTSTGSNPIGQFKAALYRGECMVDELAELDCQVAGVGETEITFDATGLTPGINYFIRVDDQSSTASPVWGTFNVCVDTFPDINLMCNDIGSDADSGILYDSGGPDNNYSDFENCTFTICPASNPGCIALTVNSFDTQPGADELEFYDGTTTNNANEIGEDVSAGGGCYTVFASSGCLTVEWNSNFFTNEAGFEITWESSPDPCPTWTGANATTSPTEALIIEKLGSLPSSVSNVTVNCDGDAHAAFDGGENTGIFMPNGIVLTTGSVDYAFMPNDSDGDPNLDLNSNSDADLATLAATFSNNPTLTDACVLEMDVLAAGSELSLEYIFGSDDYVGTIGSNAGRDVMGIWISGPGIVGSPVYNGQELISVLPGTTTPVHYVNVNPQVNFEYYRKNEETILGPHYDGLTTDFNSINKKTLTASSPVLQCSTYHVKVAIADVSTNADSGIFFGEINNGLPNTSLSAIGSFDYFVEGCTNPDQLNLNLSNPLGEDLTLNVQVAGTATAGTDYNLTIPSSVTFTAGQTNLNFPIDIINDGVIEGTETIELTFVYDFGCGTFDFATVVLEIKDEPEFFVANGMDTLFVCIGSTVQLTAEGASTYSWSPAANVSNPNIANPIATPTSSEAYMVTGTLGSCNLTDDVFIEIIDLTIDIVANSSTNICEGSCVPLTANNNIGNSGLTWSPIIGLDDPTSANPNASPPQTITYTASVSNAGCTISDQITVSVDPFQFPTLTTMDTVLCLGDSLILASSTPGSTTDYLWSPGGELSDPTISNPIAYPTANSTYTLVATSPNGFCSETTSVNVEVVTATLEIVGGNYYELCLGETVSLNAITSTLGVGFTWSPDSSLTSGTDVTVIASPEYTTNYIAQLVVGGCTLEEIVTIKVDSIPTDTSIDFIPQRDEYCKGEVVSFISPSIDLGFFPDIEFEWTPNDGSFLSDDDNYNLAIIATNSQTYTRNIVNGACSNTESIAIEVIDIDVELNTGDPNLCAGEELDLEVTGADTYNWTISNSDVLTCNDCPNPTLSAWGNSTVTVIGEREGCQDVESIDVTIIESPLCNGISFSPNNEVGLGESVNLYIDYLSGSSVTIEWTNQGNTIGQGDSIEVIALESSNTFIATVTNSEGCSCVAPVEIFGVKQVLFMPNVFTPDGDGLNDYFSPLFKKDGGNEIIGIGNAEIVQFTIFNRWGNIVYQNDTPATGWDGTKDGKDLPSDVYVYAITIKYPNGDTETDSQDVTLIR
ncbi:MAG: choice-of-anchor L domain-containing protein [Saprospiraceae bacterium]